MFCRQCPKVKLALSLHGESSVIKVVAVVALQLDCQWPRHFGHLPITPAQYSIQATCLLKREYIINHNILGMDTLC